MSPDERLKYIPVERMTLRDYFAAKAMQAWLSTWVGEDYGTDEVLAVAPGTAQMAYEMADAMLQEREK